MLRFPITLTYVVSALPLVFLVVGRRDLPIPEIIEWVIAPAYLATFAVSVTGLSTPLNYIVTLLLCVGADYLIWTPLPRSVRRSD
jgi:hypothetical protein